MRSSDIIDFHKRGDNNCVDDGYHIVTEHASNDNDCDYGCDVVNCFDWLL